MPRAIPYQRFSSLTQSKGSSLERQQAIIESWFKANPDIERSNLNPIDKAKSAYKGDHLKHGFGLILESINSKVITEGDFILVESIDRVGRLEPLEMISIITKIVEAGVSIVTLEDNNVYSKATLNSAMSELFVLVGKIQQAHQYSKNLSRRISASYESKRRIARQGGDIKISTPFWLNSSGKLIPDRADAIKDCINLYLKGRGSRAILIELGDKYPDLAEVHPTTLKRWFTNKALIGDWHNKGEVIKSVFEPLIGVDKFYELRDAVNSRYRRMSPSTTYITSGILICARCNKSYRYRTQKHKGNSIIYTNCSLYLKRGTCTNNKSFPYPVVLEIFNMVYEKALEDFIESEVTDSKSKQLKPLNAELEEINTAIESLLNVLDTVPNQQNAIGKIATHEERRQELLAKVDSIEESQSQWGYLEQARANNILEHLYEDPVQLRQVLLDQVGFKIKADGLTLRTDYSVSKVVKRSTKYNCYLVEHTDNVKGIEWKLAVNNNGLLWRSSKFKEWADFLEYFFST